LLVVLCAAETPIILFTNAAKYYQALPHQDDAWNYLQDQLTSDTLSQFASIYRNGTVSSTPFTMVNAAKYYIALPYQDDAFNWLQSEVSSSVRSQFATLYRQDDTDSPTQPTQPPAQGHSPVLGMDVSAYQPDVDWNSAYKNGARFAYIKATEGTNYISDRFAGQYSGATKAGFVRGAYHFALPDESNGATQAKFLVSHGGGWSEDGITLPPALDIEYNPYGPTCYDLSTAEMVTWIKSFSDTVKALTGRYPVIYSTLDWWTKCTGNSGAFGNTNPLWIASYSSRVKELPQAWGFYTFWQFSDHGTLPGDQDYFNGDENALRRFAKGS